MEKAMGDAPVDQGLSRVAIRADRAFDGRAMIPGGGLVLCAGGRIVGVEPATAPVPDGWPVAEFPRATVIPGMIDCHVHLCGDSRNGALDRLPGYSDEELGQVIGAALRAQLAAGVTTVRDLGDRRWAVLDWRQRAAAGTAGFPGPAIVASGPPITTPGGHCWHMGGEAAHLDELRAAVRERAERGADIIKIMASGGVMTAGTDVLACQYSLEQLRTVVDEAHIRGLAVTAHAHGLPAVIQAVDAGADGIEHCRCLTERGIEVPEDLPGRLAANRIIVCPTMGRNPGATPPPAVVAIEQRTGLTWQARQAMAGKLHIAGVIIASGSDAGISSGKPHGILANAIADLVAGGIPAADALASATSVAAAACGLGDRKGRLHAGYDADLAVIDGDPRTDIHALTTVQAVYVNGQAVTEPAA
jgi:imidazolonepropionase-like amidohydrolase